MNHYTVALIGNPNVGKSTVFNQLTGKRQHTGNWEGKTVEIAKGTYKTKDTRYDIIDLPGIYSLNFRSPEEKIAKDFLMSKSFDLVLVICDSANLFKNLKLALEVIEICPNTALCINMMDEAERKGISIDINGLKEALNIPIVTLSARKNATPIKTFLNEIENLTFAPDVHLRRDEIINRYVTYKNKDINITDKKIDKILCGKYTAVPTMILFLALILWLTISGANFPSLLLSNFLSFVGNKLGELLLLINTPPFIYGIVIDGAYSVMAQVVSVMLPPMAIFFPLFSLLEESGFLPRIALNLDKPFKKAGSSGKQALTMCMGLGCNAVGVTGCRIIPSKKQQLIAILTNSFMPCNGRFPTVILLIGILLGKIYSSFAAALLLTLFILLSITVTFIATKILNKFLKGDNLTFDIELTSYRFPPILKTIADSFVNKALHILGRAVIVSAPAGAILWLLSNITVNNLSLLTFLADFLSPLGAFLAMDGVILLSFILGSPANEIVLPIAAMIYLSNSHLTGIGNNEMVNVFINNGWNGITALSVIIFSLFHWPCTTTLLTIKKETNSLKYTFLSVILPTVIGSVLCIIINLIRCIYTGF